MCSLLTVFPVHNFLDEKLECPDPKTIRHGVNDPPNGPFFCGDKVTYLCDNGYEMQGESVSQCTETGQFSNLPECVIPGEFPSFAMGMSVQWPV